MLDGSSLGNGYAEFNQNSVIIVGGSDQGKLIKGLQGGKNISQVLRTKKLQKNCQNAFLDFLQHLSTRNK
jgi:hypothetical protein